MNKKISNFIFLIALLGISALPFFVLALTGQTELDKLTTNVISIVWKIGAAIIVIGWIVTGILFLMAQGAPDKLETAKKAFIACVIGTVLVIIAFSAKTIIESALTTGE